LAKTAKTFHGCFHVLFWLKQNSFKLSKLFRNSFETVLFQYHFVVRTTSKLNGGRSKAPLRH